MPTKKPNLAEELAGGKLVTAQDILAWLEISQRTLRYWIAHGDFPKPARRKGRKHLWLESEVKKWVLEEFDRPADTGTEAPPGTLKRCSKIETQQARSVYNALVYKAIDSAQGRIRFSGPNSPIAEDGTLALNPNIPSARIAFTAPKWRPIKNGKLVPLPSSGVAAFFVLVDSK
jgi:predicted DNA-binding transcriptional regulator AlpA